MPFPRFMATTAYTLAVEDITYNAFGIFKMAQEHSIDKDSEQTEAEAVLLVEGEFLGELNATVRVMEQDFRVRGIKPVLNPDGTIHHTKVTLVLR